MPRVRHGMIALPATSGNFLPSVAAVGAVGSPFVKTIIGSTVNFHFGGVSAAGQIGLPKSLVAEPALGVAATGQAGVLRPLRGTALVGVAAAGAIGSLTVSKTTSSPKFVGVAASGQVGSPSLTTSSQTPFAADFTGDFGNGAFATRLTAPSASSSGKVGTLTVHIT